MTKDIIKKGFAEAEKQQQEDEVKKVKEIVQKHLEKIAYHNKEAKEHTEKSRLLKKDLDDLKAGRLDRIEERQEKDSAAKEVRIIEVHRIVDRYIPLRPWLSPFNIEWSVPYYPYATATAITTAGSSTTNAFYADAGMTLTSAIATSSPTLGEGGSMTLTGTNCSNFAGGTYEVDRKIINL